MCFFSLYYQVKHGGNVNRFSKTVVFILQTVCLHSDLYLNRMNWSIWFHTSFVFSYAVKEPQSAGNTTSRDIFPLSTLYLCHKRGVAEKKKNPVNMLWLYCHAEYFCEAAVRPWIGSKTKSVQLGFFLINSVFLKLPTSPKMWLRLLFCVGSPDIIHAQPDPLPGVRHPQPRGRTGPQ